MARTSLPSAVLHLAFYKEVITMPLGLLWVLEAVYSTAGNSAPAPILSGAKGCLPGLNVARVG